MPAECEGSARHPSLWKHLPEAIQTLIYYYDPIPSYYDAVPFSGGDEEHTKELHPDHQGSETFRKVFKSQIPTL